MGYGVLAPIRNETMIIYIKREELERQMKAEWNDPSKFDDVKLEVYVAAPSPN